MEKIPFYTPLLVVDIDEQLSLFTSRMLKNP